MPLTNDVYKVYLYDPEHPYDADHAIEHTVTVRHGDILRAELEANKINLPTAGKAPINASAAWVWAAMARENLYSGKLQEFRMRDLAGMEEVESEDVDPTQPAAGSTSASDSPGSTATPATGSTPTSTTGS